MNFDELWTFILELIASIIIPAWNNLIQYIPLLLLGLLILSVLGLAWWWRRHAAVNRPRVPTPRPMGQPPPGIHLPGPSPWPFVAPIGLLLMLFSLGVGLTSSGLTLGLFVVGAMIGLVGIAGWYWDAGREYRQVEAGGHGAAVAAVTSGQDTVPGWALEPPPGVHLPGPSAWPFLAPIGLGFAVAGLIFSPILLIAGLVMAAIASVGWLLDANRELADVEAHGHATPSTRDPEAAWPKALGPLYVGIAAVALGFVLLPWALSQLPNLGAGDAQTAGVPPTSEPYVSASTATEFEVTEIAVFADEPFQLTFENKQEAVPHNVAIYDSPELATEYFVGEIFPGPETRVYDVPALAAGEYFYICSVHPPMTGTLYSV